MRDHPFDPDEVARRLGLVAMEAGRLLAARANRGAGRRRKPDGSPTTAADLESERLILARLADAWPDVPAVAEESAVPAGSARAFFLIDPLDGTRDYLAGEEEYAVNIALVVEGRPIAAALAAPGIGRIWIAGRATLEAVIPAEGEPATWAPARARPIPAGGMVALVSRRHGDPATEACLGSLPVGSRRTVSSALKFGLIASGEADLYIRCGATMEWDTAAGDHIVARAGGLMIGPDGSPLRYGRPEAGYLNGAFAAFGDPTLASHVALPA
jgi:3'(2'), 5'-bisphosphate nucleotidase